jgi:hypothetical protein
MKVRSPTSRASWSSTNLKRPTVRRQPARGEENVLEFCRREGIAASMYGWSKEFLEGQDGR